MLTNMAVNHLAGKDDLRSRLAVMRLRRAVEALEGSVDMEAYERKVFGLPLAMAEPPGDPGDPPGSAA